MTDPTVDVNAGVPLDASGNPEPPLDSEKRPTPMPDAWFMPPVAVTAPDYEKGEPDA